MKFATSICCLGLLLSYGCQRNSNELMPPLAITNTVTFTKTASAFQNQAIFDAFFTEHLAMPPDTLSVHFKAKPGVILTSATLLVEYYSGAPGYNSFMNATQIALSGLTASTSMPDYLVNVPSFPLDSSNVSVYLLSDTAASGVPNSFQFSGQYQGYAYYPLSGNASGECLVQGFVDAGGDTHLFLSCDNQPYNLVGNFSSDGAHFINGQFNTPDGQPVSTVFSVVYNNYSGGNFQFQLQPSQGNNISIGSNALQSLNFVLSKQ